MASSFLPNAGSEGGPCAVPCEHRDCAETRRMAESLCTACSKPIGYDRHFYRDADGWDRLVHYTCFHRRLKGGGPTGMDAYEGGVA